MTPTTKSHLSRLALSAVGPQLSWSRLVFVLILLMTSKIIAQTEPVNVFGPEVFIRSKGDPLIEERQFDISGFQAPFVLHLRNGDENGNHRVSYASVWLNDILILDPSDFSQQASDYDLWVTLTDPSVLRVELESKPGSEFMIWIDTAYTNSHTVGPEGGTVIGTGGALVIIPPGALVEETLISVNTHCDSSTLPAPVDELWTPFLGGVSLGPDGLVFQQPITIIMPLTTPLSGGTKLPLFLYVEELDEWVQTEFSAVVNPDGLSARAEVTHFTHYVILGHDDLYFERFREQFFDICTLTPMSELFDDYINWFSNIFILGKKHPWDFSAHYQEHDYGCYQITGVDYVFSGARATPDPANPENWVWKENESYSRETGEHGAIAIVFDEHGYKEISDSLCGEYQLTYTWTVTVYFQCVLPELSLEADISQLNVGEQTTVRAYLECGGEPLKDQKINWFVAGDGEIDRGHDTTSSGGIAEVVFTAANPSEGSDGAATVIAIYDGCSGQEGEGEVEAEVEIDIQDWCNEEAYIAIYPRGTCIYVGQTLQLTATVMVYDPDLDEYVPSDCHGTDFVWSHQGDLPAYEKSATINCHTGLVTAYSDIGPGYFYKRNDFKVHLQDKPWIFGEISQVDVHSLELLPISECLNPGEEHDFCCEPWCVLTRECSQREPNLYMDCEE